MIIWIYQIRNIINNKVYIGSTNNVKKRKTDHFSYLRNNKHHSIKLQNSWNKYGEDKFVFEVLLEQNVMDKYEQIKIEQEYFERLTPCKNGYNMSCIAEAPRDLQNWTPEKLKEMGRKVSERHKGKTPKNFTLIKGMQAKPILEYEHGLLIREYKSTKQAGEILGIDYKLINNLLRGKVRKLDSFPQKVWKYKYEDTPIKLPSKNKDKGVRIIVKDEQLNIVNIFFSIKECIEFYNIPKHIVVNNIIRGQKARNLNLYFSKIKINK